MTSGFNPRLPGGRRRGISRSSHAIWMFQSTPSGGKATLRHHCVRPWRSRRFNPRLPGGRRRIDVRCERQDAGVSIHAFRGEGDRRRPHQATVGKRFNPRLPGGRRLVPHTSTLRARRFQSTPSGGKATCARRHTLRFLVVSIHAFRGEGDDRRRPMTRRRGCFNPRLPGGRRPQV